MKLQLNTILLVLVITQLSCGNYFQLGIAIRGLLSNAQEQNSKLYFKLQERSYWVYQLITYITYRGLFCLVGLGAKKAARQANETKNHKSIKGASS